MAELSGYDAAYPPAHPPTTDVVCFYAGGDTPHVWTAQEIQAQPARYRLPIWVRSDPTVHSPTVDAAAFLTQLSALGCPKNVATVLDLETAVDPSYVYAFGAQMHGAGYQVLPYGSSSTLFKNPKLDGYFVALPGATMIPSNCVAVQYGQGPQAQWDLDLFSPAIALWDTRPHLPLPKEKAVLIINNGTTQYLLFDNGTKLEIPDPADLGVLSVVVPGLPAALSAGFVGSIPDVS